MCGIACYVGRKDNAAEIVLEGLKLLEYRGYDSWGIAVKKNKKVSIDKHVGKIGNATTKLPKSNIGIGHTRWATHGGVTQANAHPHTDCTKTIAVLHNGIIENYSQLKEELQKKGHRFTSETDTEIVPHMIEENLKKMGFTSAVRDTFNKLRGLNAIVVLNTKSSEIIAAKNGSPLVIGETKDGYHLASDAIGIVKHTKKALFLEDNQMAIIGNKLQLLQLPEGKKQTPKFKQLSWKFEEASKGKHKHFFIKEIHEEPKILTSVAQNSVEGAKKLAEDIKKSYGTFFIACGSAYYAAVAAGYLFSKIAKRHTNYAPGSEFKYIESFVTSKTLVVPISQSGESIDVIEPVTRLKKRGVKVAGIVNVLGSTLYRLSDRKILLNCGPEKAVVATKSFIAMLAVLILTSYALAAKEKEGQQILKRSAKDIQSILMKKNIQQIKKVAKTISQQNNVFVIGRGLAYVAALETTLKLKEAAYIHAEAFPGGELKHGVIALIEKGTPCIVFAPHDETYEEIISNAQEVKARGGWIVGIGPKKSDVFDEFLETQDNKEGTMLSQVAISHILAYYSALERGVPDPDKPRNLAKSVTVK